MSKSKQMVTWITGDEQAWKGLNEPDPPPPPRRSLRWPLLFILVLSLGFVGGRWVLASAERGLILVEEDLVAAIETDLLFADLDIQTEPLTEMTPLDRAWREQFGDEAKLLERAGALAPPIDGDELPFTWRPLVVESGDAALEVTLNSERPVRQIRFYRLTDLGWRRTPPSRSLWGTTRQATSKYFRVVYQSQDEEAVAPLLEDIDDLYVNMRRHFALSLGDRRQTIEIDVTAPPGSARLDSDGRYRIPSPAHRITPVGMNAGEVLKQEISLTLLQTLATESVIEHEIEQRWLPMISGLRLWLLWQTDLPLAHWQEELVTWYFGSAEGSGGLPTAYREICDMHAVWMETPTQIGVPLFCTNSDRLRWYLRERFPPENLHLSRFRIPLSTGSVELLHRLYEVRYTGQALAMTTLFDYISDRYGPEMIAPMIAGMGHYPDWDSLLAALFGTTPEQFEADWRAFLEQSLRD